MKTNDPTVRKRMKWIGMILLAVVAALGTVENLLARKIVTGEIKNGDSVEVFMNGENVDVAVK